MIFSIEKTMVAKVNSELKLLRSYLGLKFKSYAFRKLLQPLLHPPPGGWGGNFAEKKTLKFTNHPGNQFFPA